MDKHAIGHGHITTSGGALDVDALLAMLPLPAAAEPTHTIDLGAIRTALNYADQRICRHEETERGGLIWTLCRACNSRWADDAGGFQPSAWPELFDRAMDLIKRLEKEYAQ